MPPEVTMTCHNPECGHDFKTRYPARAKFCSDECYNASREQQKAAGVEFENEQERRAKRQALQAQLGRRPTVEELREVTEPIRTRQARPLNKTLQVIYAHFAQHRVFPSLRDVCEALEIPERNVSIVRGHFVRLEAKGKIEAVERTHTDFSQWRLPKKVQQELLSSGGVHMDALDEEQG